MFEFKLGADPEIFVTNSGGAMSAHGLVPGTKEAPHKVPRGAYQVDGMALEFNIDPVDINDTGGWINNVNTVMAGLISEAQKSDPSIRANLSPVQEFSEEIFKSQPKEATELGCNPDYNAYTGEMNEAPDGGAVLFRTGSGHIHIGWGADIPVDHPEHMQICQDFIKYLDKTVGLYMTIIDNEPRRRQLYGKAGAFRPKSYGVEYRTPSNSWLKSLERKVAVQKLAAVAVSLATAQTNLSGVSDEECRKVIDEGDWMAAKVYLDYVLYSSPITDHKIITSVSAAYLERDRLENPDKASASPKKKRGVKVTGDALNVW